MCASLDSSGSFNDLSEICSLQDPPRSFAALRLLERVLRSNDAETIESDEALDTLDLLLLQAVPGDY